MLYTHYLAKTNYSDFLQQERIDPITGEKIEEGHTIVICAACKSAFFIESWKYLEDKHCNQENTLKEIPAAKSLQLVAKPLEYLPFLFRKGSYFSKDSNKKFWLKSMFVIVVSILVIVVISTIGVLIGNLTTPLVGLVFMVLCILIVRLIVKFYFVVDVKKSIDPKKVVRFALDLKSHSINCKKRNEETKIDFDKIKELKYSLEYISHAVCGKYHHCILSLIISTKRNKKAKYYTIFHQDQIPQWSKFLEELPHYLPILTQK